jgi:hypothetical protein
MFNLSLIYTLLLNFLLATPNSFANTTLEENKTYNLKMNNTRLLNTNTRKEEMFGQGNKIKVLSFKRGVYTVEVIPEGTTTPLPTKYKLWESKWIKGLFEESVEIVLDVQAQVTSAGTPPGMKEGQPCIEPQTTSPLPRRKPHRVSSVPIPRSKPDRPEQIRQSEQPAEPVSSSNVSGSCFDPKQVANLSPRFKRSYSPEFLAKAMPILKRAQKKYGLDPRILLHRMVGEGLGNPDARNKSSGAYGIFQFLGPFYVRDFKNPRAQRKKKILQNEVKRFEAHKAGSAAAVKNASRTNRQLWQLEYMVDYYIEAATGLYKYSAKSTKCGPSWNKMSNFNRSLFLGWGSCAKRHADTERKIYQGAHASGSYDTSILGSLDGIPSSHKKKPLCSSW